MIMLRIQVSLAVTALLIQLGMAANYTVGGPNGGWDTSTNLQAWASGQTFMVGDNLIFQFSPNHDVFEVTKADFDTCSTSNPVQTYSSSPVVIPLSSPGKRCFTCGTIGHCGQGMKVEVDILASSSAPTISPAAPPTSSPASPAMPPTSTPPPETSPSPKSAPTMSPSSTSPPETSPSPKSAPTVPPSSPAATPTSSPPPLSTVPSAEPPTSSPPPSPSSAHTGGFQASLVIGFSLMMTVLLVL